MGSAETYFFDCLPKDIPSGSDVIYKVGFSSNILALYAGPNRKYVQPKIEAGVWSYSKVEKQY